MSPAERSARIFAAVREAGLEDPSISPLKRARLEASITQEELGRRAFVSGGMISEYEAGKLPPKRTRVHIARALRRSEPSLFGLSSASLEGRP
jgi:transcriptional regulator with XRE-family HTH domain